MVTVFALCLVVAVWLFPYLWFAVVRNKIQLQMSFQPRYAVVGEEVEIQFILDNRAWLPCPFVELSIKLPPGLSTNLDGTGRYIRFRTYVRARQQIRAAAACYAIRRGLQQMQHYPVYLTINEGFGLHSLYLERAENSIMTIMPRMRQEFARHPEFRDLIGNIERFHWMYQDESRLRGIRDYQPGDPLKYIAWQASASQGKWMTKQFSASTNTSVCLLLNAQMFPEYWLGTRHDEFDVLCEMLVTVAAQLSEKGILLRLVTNAALLSRPRTSVLGVHSASSIRAIVGELDSFPAQNFRTTLLNYASTAPINEGFFIFTSYEDEDMKMISDYERRRGRFVQQIYGPDADISWRVSASGVTRHVREASL